MSFVISKANAVALPLLLDGGVVFLLKDPASRQAFIDKGVPEVRLSESEYNHFRDKSV